jgi:hypothetical protein
MGSPDFGSLSSSISIVLGVLTYFLTMVYDSSTKLLEKEIPPPTQPVAREALCKQLKRTLLSAALPLFLSFGGLFYLCLPATITVFQTSTGRLWLFDIPKTLFVYLEMGIAACLSISGWVLIRLGRKLYATMS